MKRFEKTKGFILGVILTVIVCNSILPALADSIEAFFNTINITINGEKVASIGDSYKLADGTELPYSINHKGTVYLPLRKIGELYDKDIGWDDSTKTAAVNDKDFSLSTPTISNAEIKSITNRLTLTTECSFEVNSVNGVTLVWTATNISGKTINYYNVTLYFINPVGDPAYDRNGESVKTIRHVGPVKDGYKILIYSLVSYLNACDKIVVGEVELIYDDKTSETMWCGQVAKRGTILSVWDGTTMEKSTLSDWEK